MFQEQLEIALRLDIGSDVFAILGGSVKQFDIEAQAWGFDASVSFCVSSELEADAIYPRFVSDDVIRVTLELRACVYDASGMGGPPLKLIGYAFARSFSETVGAGVAGAPVLVRRYTLQFRDAAALYWRQHFPIELYVDASLASVLDKHKLPGIALEYGDGPFRDAQAMLFLPAGKRASLYDFVCWYLTENSAQLEFDATSSTYTLTQRKRAPSSVALEPEDIAHMELVLPEPTRAELHVLNSHTLAVKNQQVSVPHGVTGLRRDVLYTTPIAKRFEDFVAKQSQPLRPGKDGLRLQLARFPRVLCQVGALLELGELFSAKLHAANTKFRVHQLSLHGKAAGDSAPPNAGLEESTGTHDIEYRLELEHKSDPRVRLPDFIPPEYPTVLEAKVVSFGGGDDDRTWFSIEDSDTALASYQIEVPLFNKKIAAPFDAALASGHFFFPAYKHARVLVALYFDAAEIVRHIDWADNARLPKDSQGNQIVFGYQKSNGTVIQHVYKDNKPELHIDRTFGNDVQTVEVSDGLLRIQVQELAGQAKLEPKYDVTVQVEAAKGQVSTKVAGSVAQLGGSFSAGNASAVAAISGASDELDGSLAAMESTLCGSIESITQEIRGLSDTLLASFDAVQAALVAAKQAIVEETLR